MQVRPLGVWCADRAAEESEQAGAIERARETRDLAMIEPVDDPQGTRSRRGPEHLAGLAGRRVAIGPAPDDDHRAAIMAHRCQRRDSRRPYAVARQRLQA